MYRVAILICSVFLLRQSVSLAGSSDTSKDVGYLQSVGGHFDVLSQTASTNEDYVARMVAPLSYLLQLGVAVEVNEAVGQMTADVSQYLVIASLNPHDGSAYIFDIFVPQDMGGQKFYVHQQIDVPVPDGPVSVSRKRLLPSEWPLSLLVSKMRKISGVYIPEPGDGQTSYFVTFYDGKELNHCGALWPIDLGKRDKLSRSLGLGLLILGIEEQAKNPPNPQKAGEHKDSKANKLSKDPSPPEATPRHSKDKDKTEQDGKGAISR